MDEIVKKYRPDLLLNLKEGYLFVRDVRVLFLDSLDNLRQSITLDLDVNRPSPSYGRSVPQISCGVIPQRVTSFAADIDGDRRKRYKYHCPEASCLKLLNEPRNVRHHFLRIHHKLLQEEDAGLPHFWIRKKYRCTNRDGITCVYCKHGDHSKSLSRWR